MTASGVSEAQAEVHAQALADLVNDELASKRDLEELRIASKRDLEEMELRLRTALEGSLREQELRLKAHLETELRKQMLWIFGTLVVVAGGIFTLFKLFLAVPPVQ